MARSLLCSSRMLASDHVVYLDGVADSPNVRIVGAHLIIYPNATALANAGSCGLCEAGFGTNTNRQDNHIAGVLGARLRVHNDGSVGPRLETRHAVPQRNADAVFLQSLSHRSRGHAADDDNAFGCFHGCGCVHEWRPSRLIDNRPIQPSELAKSLEEAGVFTRQAPHCLASPFAIC
jgi:hypothetical protein